MHTSDLQDDLARQLGHLQLLHRLLLPAPRRGAAGRGRRLAGAAARRRHRRGPLHGVRPLRPALPVRRHRVQRRTGGRGRAARCAAAAVCAPPAAARGHRQCCRSPLGRDGHRRMGRRSPVASVARRELVPGGSLSVSGGSSSASAVPPRSPADPRRSPAGPARSSGGSLMGLRRILVGVRRRSRRLRPADPRPAVRSGPVLAPGCLLGAPAWLCPSLSLGLGCAAAGPILGANGRAPSPCGLGRQRARDVVRRVRRSAPARAAR